MGCDIQNFVAGAQSLIWRANTEGATTCLEQAFAAAAIQGPLLSHHRAANAGLPPKRAGLRGCPPPSREQPAWFACFSWQGVVQGQVVAGSPSCRTSGAITTVVSVQQQASRAEAGLLQGPQQPSRAIPAGALLCSLLHCHGNCHVRSAISAKAHVPLGSV